MIGIRGACRGFIRANLARRLQAGHSRHLHIHQHQIEVSLRHRNHRGFAIIDDTDAMPFACQQGDRQLLIDRVIFRQQDVERRVAARLFHSRRLAQPAPDAALQSAT
jgi:hypothetical protein